MLWCKPRGCQHGPMSARIYNKGASPRHNIDDSGAPAWGHSPFAGGNDIGAPLLATEGGGAPEPKSARLGFVAGTILEDKLNAFERLLFRATRGNMFLKNASVGSVVDPTTTEKVEKAVFVVFFAGERARSKILKARAHGRRDTLTLDSTLWHLCSLPCPCVFFLLPSKGRKPVLHLLYACPRRTGVAVSLLVTRAAVPGSPHAWQFCIPCLYTRWHHFVRS